MNTSGPAELSRSTTTVAAGRGLAGTFTADILVGLLRAFVFSWSRRGDAYFGHGHEREDRRAAPRLRRDSEVEAEHVGLQARRVGDPRARGTDRVVRRTKRHVAQDPEHRPFVDARDPRGAANRHVADRRARDRRQRPGHRYRTAPRSARPFPEPLAGAGGAAEQETRGTAARRLPR